VAVDATKSNASTNSTVRGYVADNATLNIKGATSVNAVNNTKQLADATAIPAALWVWG